MRSMSSKKLDELIATYDNGNKSVFYEAVDRMTKLDIVNLIIKRQPYSPTIARLKIHLENK